MTKTLAVPVRDDILHKKLQGCDTIAALLP